MCAFVWAWFLLMAIVVSFRKAAARSAANEVMTSTRAGCDSLTSECLKSPSSHTHTHTQRNTKRTHLVDDEHDLFAPRPDVLQEAQLAVAERAVGAEHEQHEVGARHKLLGQALLALEDDVGACFCVF